MGASASGAGVFTDSALRDLSRRVHGVRRRFGLNNAIGIHIEDLLTGEPLLGHNADRRYVPASGMKLPVMAACIHYLGPSFRFATDLLVDAPPTDAGVIEGPVTVVGSGDPSITRHDLEFVARSLAAYGITRIEGDLILDDSCFEPQETDRELVRRRLRFREPIQSGLGYMWNRVEIAGVPGNGNRPDIRDEGYGYYQLRNRMVLRNSARPYILVRRGRGRTATVEGRILRGGAERVARFTATEPALYFGHALRGKLAEQGVTTAGEPRRLQPDDTRPELLLYRHQSAPMSQVVEALGKYSNNWSSEQLFFALGGLRWGGPATAERGSRVIEEYLVGLGFRASEFRIADGSGLSRDNRLSARMLAAVVRDLYAQPDLRDDFLCSLAVSGVDGTLARRMWGSTTLGRVIAKTGSLSGVSSLSGVAFPAEPGGRPVGFSVITNGLRNQWAGDQVENEIAGQLVRWSGAAT